MRIAATAATLLFALTACSTTERTVSPYQQPNSLMSTEINQRIDQIPYQHREELVQNLLWLAQTGEQTIPALLTGLNSENPKVRSSCCWVLGRLRDRRTVPALQSLTDDSETSVRMEACRTLVLMGDLQQSPKLIEGLDSDRKEVRYMCHEALKTATGHDFGYDHLNQNQNELQFAVLRWRQWWGEYGGDTFFASSYEQEHGLNNLAAPGGETKPQGDSSSSDSDDTTPDPSSSAATIEENTSSESTGTENTATENTGTENNASESNNSETPTAPETGTGNGAVEVPATVPPAVPPVTTEQVEVIEVGGQATSTGTETESSEHTTPIPVVEVPTTTGGRTAGGNGTTGANGGN